MKATSFPLDDLRPLSRPRSKRRRLRATLALLLLAALPAGRAETLYNGIQLPAAWPPQDVALTAEPPETPPYLASPPEVVPIDLGRQLFVDYFLIEDTTLRRTPHPAEPYLGNPVLKPDKPWELIGLHGTAMPFSDGIWFDPQDRYFKAWYCGGGASDWHHPGIVPYTLFARSSDGVHWEKPELDVKPGTNIVLVDPRDSSTLWLDLAERDPSRRFKLLYSEGTEPGTANGPPRAKLYFSADGIHWGKEVLRTAPTGDRISMFYNPFRGVWVASLRASGPTDHDTPQEAERGQKGRYTRRKLPGDHARIRKYHEGRDILSALTLNPGEPVLWAGADRLDPVRIDLGVRNELYCVDAVAYESLMVGLFSVWRGQSDPKTREKPNEIVVGFSRDGFHWDRPFREPLIGVSEDPKAWNNGNVQSVGGICLVVGDRLYVYASGRLGGALVKGENSTGLFTLRRDGFVSMDAPGPEGSLTTRPVRFGGKYLFVNVDCAGGELRAEVLDREGRVIAPYAMENCVPVRSNNTLQQIRWKGSDDLSALSGKPVKFRFRLRYGSLYSFWVSPDASGASHGYVGAGGPGFTGPTDTVGRAIYKHGFTRGILN